MKKIIFGIVALILSVCLASCGADKKEEETTAKSDWRNTIEYEGSFFVNETKKMLYALDRGSITLWDNAGEGNALQVIEYDTSVADAIERIEKEDFNGDGNCDIRIIYSESEKGCRYNLFLWSSKAGRFVECQLYNTITDPQYDSENNVVVGVSDKGVFGKITKHYAFNESSGLDEVSVTIGDLESIAMAVAASVGGDSIERIVNTVTINDIPCSGYYVSKEGVRIAYIAHTPESDWFADQGCLGFYRELKEVDGAIFIGDYSGDSADAYSLIKLLGGESATLVGFSYGVLDGCEAERYEACGESGEVFYVVTNTKNLWYYSENGNTYVQVISSTGETAGEEEYEFAVPATE